MAGAGAGVMNSAPIAQVQQAKPRVRLAARDITPEAFRPFGQVLTSTHDGKQFDSEDAQLTLGAGAPPRLYIMRLPAPGKAFGRITYHGRVTQCLGVLAPVAHWYLGVAAPTLSLERPPRTEDLTVFRIPHGTVVKLEKGTWHAGPLFEGEAMDFINLEDADTNVTDHNTHVFECVYEVMD